MDENDRFDARLHRYFVDNKLYWCLWHFALIYHHMHRLIIISSKDTFSTSNGRLAVAINSNDDSMKSKLIILVSLITLIVLVSQYYFSVPKCIEGEAIAVFSPSDSAKLFDLIKNAKYKIDLEVYEFSYKELADTLIDAKERGIDVKVILEPTVYQNNGMFSYLINNGIDVTWASKNFHNTHSKFMIVDDKIVLVGSMNWSENSMKNNREASVIVYSKELSSDFERIFNSDFQS